MPYSCQEIPYSLSIGIDISKNEIEKEKELDFPIEIIKSNEFSNYDYLITPISIKDKNLRKKFPNENSNPIFIDDYYSISSSLFKNQIIAKLHDEDFNNIKENLDIINKDLDYCNHISVKYINLKYSFLQNSEENFIFLQMIKIYLKTNPDRKINFEIEFSNEGLNIYRKLISSLEEYYQNIGMSLIIQKQIPENFKEILNEIVVFNINNITMPLSSFLVNKNGFPVLSHNHQEICKFLFKFKPDLIIKDDINVIKYNQEKNFVNFGPMKDCYIYLTYLFKTHKEFKDRTDDLLTYYYDVLQFPLQPLKDNLQSQVYQSFEEDNTKYKYYENAIFKCIEDLKNNKNKLTIGIFGGGRGPIIRSAINAINNNKLDNDKYTLFCVEKNINAFNTLLNLKKNEEIFSNVKMINCDMRYFNPMNYDLDKIDICISELLGSFGDNELSPECLINLKEYMNENGIMIPQEYSSYLRPIYCPSIWSNINAIKENYNSPYIILLQRAFYPIEKIEKCFTFKHYLNEISNNFNQKKSISFIFDKDTFITGFVGYFDTILYKDIKLSICPNNEYTQKLFSWFPIYFPSYLQIPIKKNDILTINISRINDGKKVWYEWNFDNNNDLLGYNSKIHNFNGEGYSILL